GVGDTQTLAVDLPLGRYGNIKRLIREAAEANAAVAPTRVHLVATGLDQTGQTLRVAPLDVPLSINGADLADAPDVTFAGAGDIAMCGSAFTEATARILDRIPGSVFTLGDTVYPTGTIENFISCYDPTWGRHRSRTFAAPGNHDWDVGAGAPYFSYFGS